MSKLIDDCSSLLEEKNDEAAKNLVEEFSKTLIQELKIPFYCKNEINESFIYKKLLAIIVDHELQSNKIKKEICINVISNFRLWLEETSQRVEVDVEQRQLTIFGISSRSLIAQITSLGNETHYQGKGPCLIEFNNGAKIVYKPRSCISKEVLCKNNTGLFASTDIPTYKILNKEIYAYCEFIEETNDYTFNIYDLIKYYQQIYLIEAISHRLKLKDLHSENIIVKNYLPFLIDTEVIMQTIYERDFVTDLVSGQFAGGLEFVTKNRIHLPEQLEYILTPDIQNRLILQQLAFLGIDVQALKDQAAEKIQELDPSITEAAARLRSHKHRFIPLSTNELAILIKLDLPIAIETFVEMLSEKFSELRLQFMERKHVIKSFSKDFFNNDVPVFHFLPSTRAVFYHDKMIGQQR